jgi:hypothetical protein
MLEGGAHTVPGGARTRAPRPGRAVRAVRGVGMDRLREFLETVRSEGVARGNLRGLLHVLIGRRIALADGTEVSAGMTWRDCAGLLKRARWDREVVREIGVDPATLPPRDRQRFWYTAIAQAGLATPAASESGDQLIEPLGALGYVVGPAPRPTEKPVPKKRPSRGPGRGRKSEGGKESES